jgi:hypothetical protein
MAMFSPGGGKAALEAAFQSARYDGWDGPGSKGVEQSTHYYAEQFLKLLPSHVAFPDIAADTDGEILFEWDRGRRQVFTVSVGREGVLSFAGLFGQEKIHGRRPLDTALTEILPYLERFSPHAGS